MKTLGYASPVSKTALFKVGSALKWPSLLAALLWHVDYILVLSVSGE